MSIVKNDTSSSTAMTIMKLEKVVNNQGKLASPPLPSGHPLIGFATKYYLELNNYSFQLDFYSRAGETVIIRAMIDPDAEGFIYGFYDGNSVRYIRAYDGKLQWFEKNNSSGDATTPILEREIDGKIHNFGYQGYDDNGTLKCKPYYDKENITVGASTVSYTTAKALLFKQNGQSNVLHSTNTWAIRLYEVAACSFPDSADTAQYQFHYYAAMSNDSTPVKCLMETRHELTKVTATAGSSVTGVTNRQEIGDFPSKGYGVQLHDLKDITGSGFNDLLAILCEDDGVDGAAGWVGVSGKTNSAEAAYKLTKSGESDREFGIYLGSSSSHMPIPSGWSIPSARSYDIGELIKGRKLKWNIWCDSLKWGKYGTGNTGQLTTMKFNIFRNNDATINTNFNLERFHGWNTGSSHAPHMHLDGEIRMEYHNGYNCTLTVDNRICGYMNSGYEYNGGDENFVFPFTQEAGGLGTVKLGNLPLWNYSEAEQETQSDLSKLWAIGGGIQLKIEDVSTQVGWRIFGTMMKTVYDVVPPDTFDADNQTWPMPFSSDSSAETLAMFRDNGFDCSSMLRGEAIEQMRDNHSERCVRNLRATLMLSNTSSESPYDSQMIDCSRLVPNQDGQVQGIFDNCVAYYNKYRKDPQHYTSDQHYNDRFVVGEQGGIAKIEGTEYLIGAQGSNRSTSWGEYNIDIDNNTPNYGKGIGFGFGLKNKNNDNLYPILTESGSPIMAYLQITEADIDEGTVTTEEIDTYDTQNITPIATGELLSATAVTVSGTSMTGTTTRYEKEAGSSSTIYKFYVEGYDRSSWYNVKMNVSSSTHVQTEIEFAISSYSGDQSEPSLIITVPTTSNATITGTVNNAACSIIVRKGWHRWVNNKYIGFSKVISTNDWETYVHPLGYNNKFWQTEIQPWDIGGSRSSTIACVLFTWRELLGMTFPGTDPSNWVRPTKEIEERTSAMPSTFHLKFFSKTTGPHAWSVMKSGNRHFDTLCEVPFVSAGEMGNIKRIYYHNAYELLEHSGQYSYYFANALISLWPTMSGNYYVPADQITAPNSLNGKSVYIYEEVLHEPADQWDFTRDSNNDAIPLVRFDITGLSSSKKTDTFNGKVPSGSSWTADATYRCRVTADVTWPWYTRQPTGNVRHGEVGLGGYFRIEVWNSADGKTPKPGSIYYIELQNTPS